MNDLFDFISFEFFIGELNGYEYPLRHVESTNV
jgi:hypothetical protein